ncbi:hypothetical protein GCM10009539_73470 [Cryptosporangium japonicum]|uniref:Uncharacterized protein n=2 Tax=Cryptosporangium japonicum TaxID=80872 RepID=A0ABN0V4K2_9ACTN
MRLMTETRGRTGGDPDEVFCAAMEARVCELVLAERRHGLVVSRTVRTYGSDGRADRSR